jgi:glutathione S-transferase
MQLFTTPISPNGKRVRICASELGITLESVHVDFQKSENRSPDYLALNPMGKVPTLKDGTFVLWESAAILCYLAQKGDGSLWPKTPQALSDMLRWMFFGSCHVDPYFTTLVVERFIKGRRNLPCDEKAVRDAEQWLARFVPVVERELSAHEFVAGGFGLADIVLGCTLELSPMLKYDLDPYPAIRSWLGRLQARPSWRAE